MRPTKDTSKDEKAPAKNLHEEKVSTQKMCNEKEASQKPNNEKEAVAPTAGITVSNAISDNCTVVCINATTVYVSGVDSDLEATKVACRNDK